MGRYCNHGVTCRRIVCLHAQGLDIFAKDFLFVPIHDHLHWSLLVICHPGATRAPGGPAPCMLHLDSMASAWPPPACLPRAHICGNLRMASLFYAQ